MRGRVALVTGAGPGIGRATAQAFAEDGADVVVAARRPEALASLAAEIADATGRRVLPMACDVKDVDTCRRLVADTVRELGRIDALVNVATHPFPRQRVADFDWTSYAESLQLNVIGTMTLCGEAAKRMVETGGGGIVNIGTLSTTAFIPKNSEYSSTKAAMIAMSKTMAREMGRHGVRVNIVTPGFTTGEPLDQLMDQLAKGAGTTREEMSERTAKQAALARHVDPEDIAEACLYLCSERARNVTGVELHVTAGAIVM